MWEEGVTIAKEFDLRYMSKPQLKPRPSHIASACEGSSQVMALLLGRRLAAVSP